MLEGILSRVGLGNNWSPEGNTQFSTVPTKKDDLSAAQKLKDPAYQVQLQIQKDTHRTQRKLGITYHPNHPDAHHGTVQNHGSENIPRPSGVAIPGGKALYGKVGGFKAGGALNQSTKAGISGNGNVRNLAQEHQNQGRYFEGK